MTGLEVVPYRPELRPGLFALMRDVWGSWLAEDEFDGWYERNPVRPGTISLAVAEDRVAVMLAMSYARMRLGGRDSLVAFAIDGATHPDFRGRGIFQKLELENERVAAEAGASTAIGFTNPQAGPILVGRVGWADVRPLRLQRYNVEPYPARTFELVLSGACDLIALKDTVAGTHARRLVNAALGTSSK